MYFNNTLAKKKLKHIPIIFAMVLNWEQHNLKSKNITGISLETPSDILFGQFQMLVPDVRKVGVLYNPESSGNTVEKAKMSTKELGIELVTQKVDPEDKLLKSFNKIASKVDGLWMMGDPVVVNEENFEFLLKETLRLKIPFIAYSEPFVEAGAFLSLSPDYSTIGDQAGAMAKKILVNKIPPSKIKITSPIGTSLVINKTTALKIGLQINDFVLQMADKIIEE